MSFQFVTLDCLISCSVSVSGGGEMLKLRLYDLQPGTWQHMSFPIWGWRQRKMATMMTQFFKRYSMTIDPWGRTDCNSGIQQLKLTRQFSKWRVVNLMAGQLPDWVFPKNFQGTNSSSKESICWSTGVGALPPTMTQARISVPKKGKDPWKRESLLSLLCCDCEILTKVIAWRLELVMHTVTQNRLALLQCITAFWWHMQAVLCFAILLKPHPQQRYCST